MKLLHARPASLLVPWGAPLLVACVLSSPAATWAAPATRPAALVAPKQVALRLADVTHIFGKGYSSSGAGPLPRQNAAAAAAALHSSVYSKLIQDWVSGYQTEYTSLVGNGATVKSSVNLYKTAGIAQQTAQATYASRLALIKHAGGDMFKSSLTRYSGVGQYAELTTSDMKSASGSKSSILPGAHQVTLTFTRGHYAVTVQAVASSPVRLASVVAAARLMDNRLQGG